MYFKIKINYLFAVKTILKHVIEKVLRLYKMYSNKSKSKIIGKMGYEKKISII